MFPAFAPAASAASSARSPSVGRCSLTASPKYPSASASAFGLPQLTYRGETPPFSLKCSVAFVPSMSWQIIRAGFKREKRVSSAHLLESVEGLEHRHAHSPAELGADLDVAVRIRERLDEREPRPLRLRALPQMLRNEQHGPRARGDVQRPAVVVGDEL